MANTESKHIGFKPLGDRILVRRIEEKEQRKGSIIIPDSAKEKPQEAEVIEVGPGILNDKGKRVPLEVKQGQYVLIEKYGGTEIRLGEDKLLVLREDEVLGVLK